MTSFKQSRISSGTVPYRLRLSDAHGMKHMESYVKKQRDVGALTEKEFEEKWRNFLIELENAHREIDLNHLSLQEPFNGRVHDSSLPKLKTVKPIWIPLLELWLTPAKALVFEKYWGKLLLGRRIFSSDPAPHIPRCTHCKLTSLPQDRKDELMKKNALDAQRRLERLREAYRQQESRKIEEINAKLAAFKRSVRNWQTRGQSGHRDASQNTQAYHQDSTRKLKNVTRKRQANIPKILTEQEESPFSRSPFTGSTRSSLDGYFSQGSVQDVQSSNGYFCFDESRINEELSLLENIERGDSVSAEDNSEELKPVQLPDWVQDFIDKKRKAQLDVEAARQMPQEDMPIPVWVECVDDDGDITVTAAEISQPPHGAARCLDNTASLMEKQAPRPIGMESRELPNAQIKASSEQGPYYKAHEARLNNKPKGKIIGAWCPKNHDNCQWLQIDMGTERNVQQIGTQGMPLLSVRRPKDRRWVESYVLSYSSDGLSWKYYEDENNNPKIFIANIDLENTAKNSFVSGLKTRYLRIHPTSWSTGIALRVEIYVEKETKGKEVETSDSVPLSKAVTGSLASDDDRESCSENHSSEESDSGSEYILHDHLDDEEDDICNADEAKSLSNSLHSAACVEEGDRFSQASVVKGVASDGFHTRLSSFRESAQSASIQTDSIKEVLASNEERISESHRHSKSTIGSKTKVKELLGQQRPEDRKRLTFRAIVGRLMSIPNISTGLTLDAEEEKDEFLSKYCILKDSQKILFSRVFQKLDHDCDGLIEKEQLMGGLAALNLNSLKDAEMNYIMELIDVFDETIQEGIDQKTFNVIAAFADRLKHVDAFTRGIIRDTNFATLYLHAHKTRDLFEKMLDKGETTISSEQFLIELEAGGVKSEAQNLVRTYTDEKKNLDFLDFAIYFPLFLHTHEQIMSTPL